jgi:methionine synthase II (cobalamin-independent)
MDSLVETIRDLSEAADLDRLWVTPSSGLEFLPRDAAKEKCRLLADAAARFREET